MKLRVFVPVLLFFAFLNADRHSGIFTILGYGDFFEWYFIKTREIAHGVNPIVLVLVLSAIAYVPALVLYKAAVCVCYRTINILTKVDVIANACSVVTAVYKNVAGFLVVFIPGIISNPFIFPFIALMIVSSSRSSVLKPIGLGWISEAYDFYFKQYYTQLDWIVYYSLVCATLFFIPNIIGMVNKRMKKS